MGMGQSSDKVPVSTFLKWLESCRGIPYLWAGKDPHGLDCSGLMTYCLKMSGGPDLTAMWNCAKLIGEVEESKEIDYVPGMLAFYGLAVEHPNHVMSVYSSDGTGALVSYGACGGNHYMDTIEKAKKVGACVRERPRIAYRTDFLYAGKWKRLDYEK